MNQRVRTLGAVGLLAGALVSLSGCSGADRPPPAADDVTVPGLTSAEQGNPIVCKPSEHRDCKRYFTDVTGQQNCTDSHQFCNEEGTAWYPCGDFAFDLNGQPIPPVH